MLVGIGCPCEHKTSGASRQWSFFRDADSVVPMSVLKRCSHAVSGLVATLAQWDWAVCWCPVEHGYVVCPWWDHNRF
jgi:hypothetical protein